MKDGAKRKPLWRARNIVLLTLLVIAAIAGRQVYLALTATPGSSVDYNQKFVDLSWSFKPGATEEDNAYPLLMKASELREQALQAMERENSDFTRAGGYDFSLLYMTDAEYMPGNASNTTERTEMLARQRLGAQKVLDKYRELGVFDILAQAATKPLAVLPKHTGKLIDIQLPSLGVRRDFARANGARMRQARRSENQHDFAPAYEQTYGLGRLCTTEPLLISHLVGTAIVSLATTEARKAIMAGDLNPQTLRQLAEAMDRQGRLAPVSHVIDGEHIAALDIIQWTHTDDGSGDGRRIVTESHRLADMNGITRQRQATRIGNLAAPFYPSKKELTAKMDEFYTNLRQNAALPFYQRQRASWSADEYTASLEWNYDIIKLTAPSTARTLYTADLMNLEIAGLRVLVAIELYRAERGALPASLDDLVPGHLAQLPTDPFAPDGKFRYRVLETPDAHGRTYLLYSVGFNGVDDNGDEAISPTALPGQPLPLRATDTVINRIEVLK